MCKACWNKMRRPRIDNPRVRAAALAIRAVDESAFGSGYLHIIIDDWNLDDIYIKRCELDAEENNQGIPDDELSLQFACLEALKPLSEKERASALASNEGWVNAMDK